MKLVGAIALSPVMNCLCDIPQYMTILFFLVVGLAVADGRRTR